jgi:hypothetical protein
MKGRKEEREEEKKVVIYKNSCTGFGHQEEKVFAGQKGWGIS